MRATKTLTSPGRNNAKGGVLKDPISVPEIRARPLNPLIRP